MMPPAAPGQAALLPPQPMGPTTATTEYVVRLVNVDESAHTWLRALARLSDPTQPPAAVHRVTGYGGSPAAASSAMLGSPAMAPRRRPQAALADRGVTSENGSVPFDHAKTRRAPPTSSSVAIHAARLIDTAPK